MSPYVRPVLVQAAERRAALSVFLILVAVYTATFSGLPDTPDAEVEFQTASALVRERTLALGGTPEAEAIVRERFAVAPGVRADTWYAWFGVGQALTAVPLYLAGSALARVWPEIEARHASSTRMGAARSEYFAHLLVGWRNPLLGAWTAALVVLTATRLGVRRRVAWLCGMSYGLCTFAWPQARGTSSDVQATFLLFAAFHVLIAVRERLARLELPHRRDLLLAGAALGLAVLTRVLVAPMVAALVVAAVFLLRFGHERIARAFLEREARTRLNGRLSLLYFLLPLAVLVAAWAALNQQRFGSPFETGYGVTLASGTFFSYPVPLGLAGLIAAPGKGLLWMAPGLLLLVWGVRQARRREQGLWLWVLLIGALVSLLPVAATQSWHGAHSYGPRYALPLLPLAWLGIGLALEGTRKRSAPRGVAVFLWALGFLVALPGVLVDHMTHQDLALQAARVAWPDAVGADERERDEARFINLQWDPRFAAPWAHWRILRHRAAGLPDVFPVREIFLLDADALIEPRGERERGFAHLAWVDLSQRLGGMIWPIMLLCVCVWAVGVGLSIRALDRTL